MTSQTLGLNVIMHIQQYILLTQDQNQCQTVRLIDLMYQHHLPTIDQTQSYYSTGRFHSNQSTPHNSIKINKQFSFGGPDSSEMSSSKVLISQPNSYVTFGRSPNPYQVASPRNIYFQPKIIRRDIHYDLPILRTSQSQSDLQRFRRHNVGMNEQSKAVRVKNQPMNINQLSQAKAFSSIQSPRRHWQYSNSQTQLRNQSKNEIKQADQGYNAGLKEEEGYESCCFCFRT